METSLSGFKLQDFDVLDLLGQGRFGSVYRAKSADSTIVAIKVANEREPESPLSNNVFSEANALYSGGFGTVVPEPKRLLEIQCLRTKSSPALLPSTRGPFQTGNVVYIVMEFVEGVTLRTLLNQQMKVDGQSIDRIALASGVLENLTALAKSPLKYHGDLKPENIIWSTKKIQFIDPGYFGALECREGKIPQVVISTPCYYPHMEANDSFAIGSLIWEILLNRRPIEQSPELIEFKPSSKFTLGPSLAAEISKQEMMGRYFLSPLTHLTLPSESHPHISIDAQNFLLNSIGLELDANSVLEKLKHEVQPTEIVSNLHSLNSRNELSFLNA